jgi:CheY-like chemotaxis protein
LQHLENQPRLPKPLPFAGQSRSAAYRGHGKRFIRTLFIPAHHPLGNPSKSTLAALGTPCASLSQTPENPVNDEAKDEKQSERMKLQTLTPPSSRDASFVTGPEEPRAPIRSRRVLVADDDEGICFLISSVLTSVGFDVSATSDGQQAWEALLHEHYDLLVTDNQMPRLTGIELIERIREAGGSLPVIIVSGTFPVERVRNDPQLQIAAVLPKPFGTWELLNTVRHVLQALRGDTTAGRGTFHQLRAGLQATC